MIKDLEKQENKRLKKEQNEGINGYKELLEEKVTEVNVSIYFSSFETRHLSEKPVSS